MAKSQSPAATAAAEPDDEPPVIRPSARTLIGSGKCLFCPFIEKVSSSVCVLPTKRAPALSILCTIGALVVWIGLSARLDRAAAAGRVAGDVEDVLDREGQTLERPVRRRRHLDLTVVEERVDRVASRMIIRSSLAHWDIGGGEAQHVGIGRNADASSASHRARTAICIAGMRYSALLNDSARRKRPAGAFCSASKTIDHTRSRPEFEAAIFEDLAWLGLIWEEPVFRQSERLDAYAAALDELDRLGLLYPAFMTRAEIAATSHARGPRS